MSTHSLPVSQYGWSNLRLLTSNQIFSHGSTINLFRYFLYKTRRCGLGVYQASKQSGFDSQRNTVIKKNTRRLLSLQLVVINMNLKFHI